MGNKESEMGSSVDEEWIISCRKEILGEGRGKCEDECNVDR